MNYNAVNALIGTRWVYRDNDCWAVVRKASLSVFGIEISEIEIPEESDPAENTRLFAYHFGRSAWREIENLKPGCIVLLKNRKRLPVHIGIHIEGGNVLHCHGSTKVPGSTIYEHITTLLKRYPTIEFYEYHHNK